MKLQQHVSQLFAESIACQRAAADALAPAIATAAERIARCLTAQGRILACGNGGSASDAQHFVAELVGRFERERPGWPAIALTADSAIMTALGNDYGFDAIFARQVEALGRPGDGLLAISTSGRSQNVVEAVACAQRRGMFSIILSGRDGGPLAHRLSAEDIELRVPADRTARIQEVHGFIIHCLCDLLDELLPNGPEH